MLSLFPLCGYVHRSCTCTCAHQVLVNCYCCRFTTIHSHTHMYSCTSPPFDAFASEKCFELWSVIKFPSRNRIDKSETQFQQKITFYPRTHTHTKGVLCARGKRVTTATTTTTLAARLWLQGSQCLTSVCLFDEYVGSDNKRNYLRIKWMRRNSTWARWWIGNDNNSRRNTYNGHRWQKQAFIEYSQTQRENHIVCQRNYWTR